MPTLLPAMQGKFGSTDYWIVTMPAKELTERLTIPKELDGWEEMSIEERYQREIDYNRVKKQIAPYLSMDEDRFFGAFIVTMVNAEDVVFEPLGDLMSRIPQLYKTAGNSFGFLTLEGNEIMVPLDGQHRLAALQFAITGKDEKQQAISGIGSNIGVANDICTVILLKHDGGKSRKIFNKVNRYAKRTTKGEDLITADDDVLAVIVREDISDDVIPARLINYKSNALNKTAPEFTTLSTLYEATKCVVEDAIGKVDTQNLPSQQEKKIIQETAVEFWTDVCERVDLFSQALHDAGETGDSKRIEIRQDFVLGKPFAQLALVNAIVGIRVPDPESGARMSMAEVCQRINSLDWKVDNPDWQNVIMNGERVLSGRTAAIFAGRVISYLLGEKLSDEQEQALKKRYTEIAKGQSLRDPLF